jgi:hypothetical protein
MPTAYGQIGQPERITQQRVIALFRDEQNYTSRCGDDRKI